MEDSDFFQKLSKNLSSLPTKETTVFDSKGPGWSMPGKGAKRNLITDKNKLFTGADAAERAKEHERFIAMKMGQPLDYEGMTDEQISKEDEAFIEKLIEEFVEKDMFGGL